MELKVLSYGATISSLKVHDASGAWREVVLGFDSLDGYLADENRLMTMITIMTTMTMITMTP